MMENPIIIGYEKNNGDGLILLYGDLLKDEESVWRLFNLELLCWCRVGCQLVKSM